MKSILALALLGFSLSFCNFGNTNKTRNANNPTNANSTANTNTALTMKDRFLGTWEIPPGSDFDNGPITFKSDNTYSAQKNRRSDSLIFTGTYELRGDRIYCLGPLEIETKDGFKIEGDRISLKMDGKTVYFTKR